MPASPKSAQVRAGLGQTWPAGSEGWAAYAAAIAGATAIADKGRAVASLEGAYRRFAPAAEARGFWATFAGWVSNVYFWAVLLGGGIIFFLFSFALDRTMLVGLAGPDQARGLITSCSGSPP